MGLLTSNFYFANLETEAYKLNKGVIVMAIEKGLFSDFLALIALILIVSGFSIIPDVLGATTLAMALSVVTVIAGYFMCLIS